MIPDPSAPQYNPNQPQIQPQVSPQPQQFAPNNYGQIGGTPSYQPQPIAVGQAPFGMMQPAFASTSATAALILSILGLLGSSCYGIGFLFILISAILCIGNGKVIKANPMHPDRGTHKAAVIINWITIVIVLLFVVLIAGSGILYVWGSSLAEDNAGGELMLYDFDASDAGEDTSNSGDDQLIIISMEMGSDLSWSIVQIQISIDGAAPITCDNPGQSGGDCGSIEYGNTADSTWSVGDGVTIVESGSNLCSGGCGIEYTIIDAREGMIIASGNSYAY